MIGPDTADLNGRVKDFALYVQSTGDPLDAFKQGTGTVMFSFQKSRSASVKTKLKGNTKAARPGSRFLHLSKPEKREVRRRVTYSNDHTAFCLISYAN